MPSNGNEHLTPAAVEARYSTPPGLTTAEAAAIAPAGALDSLCEAETNAALERHAAATLAVQRATATATATATSPPDARLLRAKAALAEATETLRDARERWDRARARLTSLKLAVQARRRDEQLAASVEASAAWQKAEAAKREKAAREAHQRREAAIARVLDGE